MRGSMIENELLRQIVLASGGEVTSGTRNGLIKDWLRAL